MKKISKTELEKELNNLLNLFDFYMERNKGYKEKYWELFTEHMKQYIVSLGYEEFLSFKEKPDEILKEQYGIFSKDHFKNFIHTANDFQFGFNIASDSLEKQIKELEKFSNNFKGKKISDKNLLAYLEVTRKWLHDNNRKASKAILSFNNQNKKNKGIPKVKKAYYDFKNRDDFKSICDDIQDGLTNEEILTKIKDQSYTKKHSG